MSQTPREIGGNNRSMSSMGVLKSASENKMSRPTAGFDARAHREAFAAIQSASILVVVLHQTNPGPRGRELAHHIAGRIARAVIHDQ